jgi:hypothetical protein
LETFWRRCCFKLPTARFHGDDPLANAARAMRDCGDGGALSLFQCLFADVTT